MDLAAAMKFFGRDASGQPQQSPEFPDQPEGVVASGGKEEEEEEEHRREEALRKALRRAEDEEERSAAEVEVRQTDIHDRVRLETTPLELKKLIL